MTWNLEIPSSSPALTTSWIWLTVGCKIQRCLFVWDNLYWFNFNTGYFLSTTILIQLQHWIFSFNDYIHSTSAGLFLCKTNIYSTSTPKVMFYDTNIFLQLQQKNSLIQQNIFTQLFKFPDIDFSHLLRAGRRWLKSLSTSLWILFHSWHRKLKERSFMEVQGSLVGYSSSQTFSKLTMSAKHLLKCCSWAAMVLLSPGF